MVNFNNSVPQKVIKMNDLYNQNVSQDNRLIEAIAKMDPTPLKIFELAVSCIDYKNPPEDNTVFLEKDTIFSFFKAEEHGDRYTRFKKSLEELHKQSYFEINELKEKGKYKYKIISPIELTEWSDIDNIVKIKFTESVMPYLLEFKGQFTQYGILDIGKLDSYYSIVIYKWIRLNYNQYKTYSENGQRTEEQLIQLKNPKISVDNLRKLTDTTKKYERFDRFEAGVIKNAVDEINEKTDFKITYDKIRTGRPIGIIHFHIDKIEPKAPIPYKEDNQTAMESVRAKMKEINDVFPKAMGHKFTEQLVELDLITGKQMLDQNLMYTLYTKTYPIYEEIGSIGGADALKNHFEYVKSKMIDYDEKKKNIANYLRVAAEDYLTRLKRDFTNQ